MVGTFWTFPNLLSLSRPLLGLPAIKLSFDWGEPLLALVFFAAFAATDALDGWYARRKKTVTLWGKVIDPLSDKLFFVIAVILVGIPLELSMQFAFLVMLEISLAALGFWGFIMVRKGKIFPQAVGANYWGKVKFWAEMLFLLLLFAGRFGMEVSIYILIPVLWIAAGLAAFSMAGHLYKHLRQI